jgi:Cof subfamily protein (haloacid dehalogenase superfamily)
MVDTLYISDLDGTLLRSNETLSRYSFTTLDRLINGGLAFTVATARTPESAARVLGSLNLKLPVIYMNGGCIMNPHKGRIIAEYFLDHDLIADILALFHRFSISPIVYAITPAGEKKIYYPGIHNRGEDIYVNSRLARGDDRLRQVSDFSILDGHTIMLINGIDTEEKLRPLYAAAAQKYMVACTILEDNYAPDFFWLEVAHRSATKGQGIALIRSLLKPKRIVCFGDNLNDIDMFNASDFTYAVANAHHTLKRMATGIIESNNADGVVKFLSENFSIV